MKTKIRKIIFILVIFCFFQVPGSTASAVGQITLTPYNSAINEGQSQTIGIQLDGPPGSAVTFSISSSNPETATMSPDTIHFAANEWAQTKYFQVVVPNNGFYGDTRNIIILARASSAAANYDGIAGSASVHVTDMTSQPVNGTGNSPTENDESIVFNPNYQDPQADYREETSVNADGYNQITLPDSADLRGPNDSIVQKTGRNVSNGLVWVTDGLTPGRTSAEQTAISISLFVLFLTCIGITAALLYRRLWWQRQKARDTRWYYRNKRPVKKSAKKKS